MLFLSESYKKRLMELAGLIPERKYYNSHGIAMPFSEFVEIEVDERENYTKKKIENWQKKYKIKKDDLVIWVTPDKRMAQTYMISAGLYYDLKDAKSEEDVEKILRGELGKNADIEPVVFDEEDGVIIPESDDGDNGYLMILNKNYINKESLFETIEFNRQDLTQAYDKSGQRIQGFDLEMIKQAIREGRAIGISYKSTDMPVAKFRIVLPVTVGTYRTKSGVPEKLSAFHLAGQSERAAQKAQKSLEKNYRSKEVGNVWRLFDLDRKSFKSMWFTDKFFYEYPPGYKKGDKRYVSIISQYDIKAAEIERDAREGRGEELGEPIDLKNIKPTGPIPAESPENKEMPENPEAKAPENAIEKPIAEKKQPNVGDKDWWLKKPWNKYLKDGFNS